MVRLVLASLLVLVLGWVWADSRLPESYSVMEMGYVDPGTSGGPQGHQHGPAGGSVVAAAQADPGTTVSVTDLVTDRGPEPDVRLDLVARSEPVTLPDGTRFEGYTLDGRTPGPVVEATEGDLVEVVLRNEDVDEGATLHWHGIDVPNGEDGVAGVTQDAVLPGQEHVYRFVAEDPGTFWYHSHQVSHRQVVGGLLGAVVIQPRTRAPAGTHADLLALLHLYGGRQTLNGVPGDTAVELAPGTTARVRVINTDDGPTQLWVSGASYRVLAVDGRDLNGPTPLSGLRVTVTAGARVDLEVVVPADGAARVQAPGVSLVLGPPGATAPTSSAPSEEVDLLGYGTPSPLPFDVGTPDRRFEYLIGRRFGLLDGLPGLWWTVNGGIYPDVPMFLVEEGDVAVMEISNVSGEVHPMHLHGHHALVLSRDGVPSTGSPLWVDSLDVRDGQTVELAFLADNPGIWMDHCHNLPHAKEGLMAHVMYTGVSTPFRIGGDQQNAPE